MLPGENMSKEEGGNSQGAGRSIRSTASRLDCKDMSKPKIHAHQLEHLRTDNEHLVQFYGLDDPYKPLNWSFTKKIITTLLYGLITMGSAWASSAYAPAVSDIRKQYQRPEKVSLLGISLFLFGVGLGPLPWAPFSEVYGRKTAVLTPYAISEVL
ncbi:MFS multidrug transporter [Penicillium argentinense]|uniref:MFS multidrug transporter n=1 Tax=Penicillium argentinense TaxID=1131581 RepID=A0A9W9K6T7_9EURO|nr:MFS multidrug transporter [Penicillium argentinense]KAJ5095234.1 MFS multidrug transporter [Penicillium argentinense]